MKRIIFDMDGVLAGFNDGFRRLANEMFGTPVEVDPGNYTWDNYGGGITEDQVDRVWTRIKSDPNLYFWLGLTPLCSGEDLARIRKMSWHNDVYFVTSRVGPKPKAETEMWLRSLADITHPTVVVSSRKGEIAAGIGADYCIDDKAGNAVYVAYQSPRTKSYLLSAPYNEFPHEVIGRKVRRVKTVTEFLDDVEGGR